MAATHTENAKEIISLLMSLQDLKKQKVYYRFFKAFPGGYGEGDKFLGIVNPIIRNIVKMSRDLPLEQIPVLLTSEWHEVRMTGFLILVDRFEKLCTKRLSGSFEVVRKRDEMLQLYLVYAERANNWDLVDLSVIKIVGNWLCLPTFLGTDGDEPQDSFDYKVKLMDSLAESENLWKQRMSMVSTWKTSQKGDSFWCLRYAEKHLLHKHDLMHKAVGWMLREMGKGCGMSILEEFLEQHYLEMSRTTLRYAIERMPEDQRLMWLHRK